MPVWSNEFLDIQATIECRFTVKSVHDMIRTYKHLRTTYLSWLVEILVTYVIQSMKWGKSKQLARSTFAYCIVLEPSLPLLGSFAVQGLLAMSLCQSASMKDGSSQVYGSAWHQLRTLRKYLDMQDCGDYWHFLTSSSWSSHHPTVLLWTHAQSANICHKAAWLHG